MIAHFTSKWGASVCRNQCSISVATASISMQVCNSINWLWLFDLQWAQARKLRTVSAHLNRNLFFLAQPNFLGFLLCWQCASSPGWLPSADILAKAVGIGPCSASGSLTSLIFNITISSLSSFKSTPTSDGPGWLRWRLSGLTRIVTKITFQLLGCGWPPPKDSTKDWLVGQWNYNGVIHVAMINGNSFSEFLDPFFSAKLWKVLIP